jgi:hypothetical protein
MKMKSISKIVLIGILVILGLSYTALGSGYRDTEFLSYEESTYYEIEMIVGDNLTWSFETYNFEFKVYVQIDNTELSNGRTSDSGIWYPTYNDTFYIVFVNVDTPSFREGFIDIYYEVNSDIIPSDSTKKNISSFNPLIIIGIIWCISGTSAITIKKKRLKKL